MKPRSTLPAKVLAGILILSAAQAQNTKAPADFVDPFIGVAGNGNVTPGPQLPFGRDSGRLCKLPTRSALP